MAKKAPSKRSSFSRPKSGKSKTSNRDTPPLSLPHFENWLRNYPIRIFWGLFALIGIIVFGSYLFGPHLYLFKDIGSDTINDVYPYLVHKNTLFRTEGFPSWSFHQGMGNNVSTWFSIDPFVWFLRIIGPKSLPYAMIWTALGYLALAAFFCYKYLSLVGFSKYTTIFGALIYGFSGYVIGVHSWYFYNYLIIGTPLLLWGTELLMKKNNGLILPIALFFLAGARLPMFAFFLIVYSAFRYVDEHGWNFKGLVIFWIKIGAWSALGVLLSSYSFGGQLVKLLRSSRVSGGVGASKGLADQAMFSLSDALVYQTSVLRSFANDMLGGPINFKGVRNYLEAPFYYIGLVSLLLIPQAIYHAKKRQKYLFGGLIVLCLIFAIFPFFRNAYFLFVTDHFRVMCLHISIFFLFLSLFALHHIEKSAKVHLPTLGISLVSLLILLNYPYFTKDLVNSNLKLLANLFLILNALLLFLLNKPKWKQQALNFILLLLVAELALFNYSTTHRRDILTKSEYKAGALYGDASEEIIQKLQAENPGLYRIQKEFGSGPSMHRSINDAMVQGFFSTPSYQSINQQSYLDFMVATGLNRPNSEKDAKWSQGIQMRAMLGKITSVRYTLIKKESQGLLNQGFEKVGQVEDVRVYEDKAYLPFGFTYAHYYSIKEFEKLGQSKQDLNFMRAAIIMEDDLDKVKGLKRIDPKKTKVENFTFSKLSKQVKNRKKGALKLTHFQHDHLKGTVNMNRERLLFFSIPYDEGWSIYVDGEEKELLKVNIGFMGVVISKGKHKVELVHQTPRSTLLNSLSILGLLIYGLMIFLTWKKREENLS